MTSKKEMQEIADQAATQAVGKVLLALGVDTSNPQAIIAAQADFKHLRSWRESTEAVKRRGLLAIVTVLVTALAGAVLLYFGYKPAP